MEQDLVQRFDVRGVGLDGETRCSHYHGSLDVVAIKMKCCGFYYACRQCHEELAGHRAEVWQKSEWDQAAILCGVCGAEIAIRNYLAGGDCCPNCGAGFNPGCRSHRHFYFATEP